ncbi:helix-turn-helix domain-containing protein [Sorangium sp. So ce375]|uniref:winged helix-turn-helix transcriptional regulator n=1 Tax=Sorangium sp. So ce375 TaxID=3133306 RepID=UPI003F5B207F
MTGLRSYGDPCGIARALDLVGERWALLIVRELLLGPKRFTDLRDGLAGASPNVLSQRLRELEGGGVVRRHKEGAPTYELTDWGRELHPLLVQLGRWGARSPARPAGPLSVDALMIALEATFVADEATGLCAMYELRLGEARLSIAVDGATIAIARGAPRRPDAVIATDPATLRAVVFGDQKLADAPVELQGDKRLARAFFRLFARPRPGHQSAPAG